MFFSRKYKNATSKTIEELHKEVIRLQQLIIEAEKKNIEYHFHFDHVDIHDPKLNQLSFQLDHLDVEELSGALNLGNNFGVTVKQKEKHPHEMKTTKNGMKFTFKEKEEK
ncbi:hypothetical protein [Halobacillus mangrovi]|uniref:Uncharacterized protein n=1 Tax=Halobacillus mangrovi TaxID=402384 RepID=A0A1W5ZS71_9BACI|nr:hypothetical protein [Halobacillus mangrovi]ARI76111.1 hypothetical protein HM131_04340 [Halobacillus mangrovi]